MYGLVFITPLALIGLALTFSRWAYRRTSPYEAIPIALSIVALTVVAVVAWQSAGGKSAEYQDLERRHLSLLEDNQELVTDNQELVTDNQELVTDNFNLVDDNKDLVADNFDLVEDNKDLLKRESSPVRKNASGTLGLTTPPR